MSLRLFAACIALMLCACQHKDDALRFEPVEQPGFVAELVRPAGQEKLPAIIILAGSGGGLTTARTMATHFAHSGYAALAVAYFGEAGLPQELRDIPLEYFQHATAYISQRADINGQPIAILGVSRGAELALLLAAHNPALGPVIAIAPSSHVWGAVSNAPGPMQAAWSYKGKSVPFVPRLSSPNYARSPYTGTPDFQFDLAHGAQAQHSIPVERINAPIMLISGQDDALWPSTEMANRIVKRLHQHKFNYDVLHLSYAGAGHSLAPGAWPGFTEFMHPSGTRVLLGGSEKANRAAQQDSWQQILGFLRRHQQG